MTIPSCASFHSYRKPVSPRLKSAVFLVCVATHAACTDARPPDRDGWVLSPTVIESVRVPYSENTSIALADSMVACTINSYEVSVHCVNRLGRVVSVFGRRGEGPDEMLAPTRLSSGRDGTIGIMDGQKTAFVVFDAYTGRFVGRTSISVPVFVPASAFDSTVTGTYNDMAMVGTDFAKTLVAAEFRLGTGDVVRQWRADVPTVDECGVPDYGFPVPSSSGANRLSDNWVFVACKGHLVLIDATGHTTVRASPAYVDEKPNPSDVADRRSRLERFHRNAEEWNARHNVIDPTARKRMDDMIQTYAMMPKRYYLLRGQETYDDNGRLWLSSSRDREAVSYLDVYDGIHLLGSIRVRDRLIDFDIVGNTLVVLADQRRDDDPDWIPNRVIDWYSIDEF